MITFKEYLSEEKDCDWHHFNGWRDGGIGNLWPEAIITNKKNDKGHKVTLAHHNSRLVGEWNHSTNQGYVNEQ